MTSKILRFEYWICSKNCGMMCGYKGGAVMAKRRPSGDGMVRKRDDGRWEGRIIVGHKNNREPIYKYVLAKHRRNWFKSYITKLKCTVMQI